MAYLKTQIHCTDYWLVLKYVTYLIWVIVLSLVLDHQQQEHQGRSLLHLVHSWQVLRQYQLIQNLLAWFLHHPVQSQEYQAHTHLLQCHQVHK